MTDHEVLRGANLQTPLGQLIHLRMKELRLSPEALGFRLNYRNPAKAAGRVLALCNGHLKESKSRAALDRLAAALAVREEDVQRAVDATQQLIGDLHRQADEDRRLARETEEVCWRAKFKPHAVIDTTSKCPSQIVACGMTGGVERWLVVGLDCAKPPLTFVQQAIKAIEHRLPIGRTGRRFVPFFGTAIGFIINYTPDQAVRFDMDGEPSKVLGQAYRPGEVQTFRATTGHPRRFRECRPTAFQATQASHDWMLAFFRRRMYSR